MPPLRLRTLLLAVALIVLLTAGVACGGGGGGDDATPTPDEEPTSPPEASDIARAVVQIVALDVDRVPVWTGSGTIVSPDGLILTNGHVVDDREGEYDVLGIAITGATDEVPEPSFIAEIVAVDYTLDLAVIRLVSDLDGNPANIDDLPAITIGNSNDVEIGDPIRILGYPSIGGQTITFTEGTISGFTAQRDIAQRAWIKTDATISGGNSGGLAVNELGEIIGVPTIASSGAEADIVDCRFVTDTNRDGAINELDTCVPIGGFINGLRPIQLAMPLINAAETGSVYSSPYPGDPTGDVDTTGARFFDIVFSPGATADDQPVEIVPFFPQPVTDVCAFWQYEGMADGASWEALWFIDGELDESGSFIDDVWIGGESGSWWVCIFDDLGLPDGLYELVFSVDGEFIASEAVFVGGDHPLVEIGVQNGLAEGICYVQFSPAGAENWGQDELGPTEVIEPGDTRPFFLAAAVYDARALNCDQEDLYDERGLDFTAPGSIVVE